MRNEPLVLKIIDHYLYVKPEKSLSLVYYVHIKEMIPWQAQAIESSCDLLNNLTPHPRALVSYLILLSNTHNQLVVASMVIKK